MNNKSETDLMRRVHMHLCPMEGPRVAQLYRNNVGTFRGLHDRSIIQCGLHPGSGDLVGWMPVTITPEMVGRRVAVFASVEIKTDNGRIQDNQRHWADTVNDAGGIAIITNGPEQAEKLMKGWKPK